MRKIFTSALMILSAMAAMADGFNGLKVGLDDGTEIDIFLTDDLSISFDENSLLATTNGAEDVAIPRNKIVSFSHFYDESRPGALEGVEADKVAVSQEGCYITVRGLAADGTVTAYNAAGIAVASVASSNGVATLSLEGQPAGVYMISVNNVSFKITLR